MIKTQLIKDIMIQVIYNQIEMKKEISILKPKDTKILNFNTKIQIITNKIKNLPHNRPIKPNF